MFCQTFDVFGVLTMPAEENSTEPVTVRFTPSDLERVKGAMRLAKVYNVSDFIRQAVLLRTDEVHEVEKLRGQTPRAVRFRRRNQSLIG